MDYVFAPRDPTAIPVAGIGQLFPVHRIYCVGRNYAEHAREMGAFERDPPFFFMKPADAATSVADGRTLELPYPPATNNFHHELELVVAIGLGGSDVRVEDAERFVFGYAVGLDMTRRDLQTAMKDNGRPWEIGKALDRGAPIGPIHRASDVGSISSAKIELTVNGTVRQSSDLAKMTWSVPETIAHLSRYFELVPGDLVFTGTPEGVGAVKRGDLLVGRIERLGELRVAIV